jgi:pyruvate/2-oxoglutarate dehydrogenase complex dihydrolipoamide dehydrogenase (E3) component
MSQTHYDISIIGGGSAGLTAAHLAQSLGSNVLLVDKERLGGDCLHYGCVPSKSLIHVARLVQQVNHDAQFGLLSTSQGVDMAKVSAYVQTAIQRVSDAEKIYTEGVTVRFGQTSFISPTTLLFNNEEITSRSILLATGSRPAVPQIEGLQAIGGYLFTHVASYQAGIAVRNTLVPLAKKKVDYRVVPWCTFTDPEVARVGLTATQAEKQYTHVRTIKFPWSEIDRAQTANETAGFIKLVLAEKKEQIVGAHIVGAGAGELLGEIALAMQHHLTVEDILSTIHAYPTLSTGVQQAAFEAYLTGPAAARNRKFIHLLSSKGSFAWQRLVRLTAFGIW